MNHPVLNGGMFGIMSGENPHARPVVQGGHHALHGALSKLVLPFEEVKGHYGQPERSFIIHNISEDALKKLGKDFGQESVIHSVGGHHKLHYVTGAKAGHYEEGRGMEFFEKPPEDFYTELPGHGYFRLHFQQAAAHPHSYEWHDGHTGHHGGLAKADNEGVAPAGSSAAYHDIAQHFGTVGQAPSNLKHYRYEGKGPDVENLVRSHGYQTYYAGGKHGKPDLANKNYNTRHLMIYDPEAGSGGDFGETQYTDAWRKVHELGHALTLPELNAKYGEARRMGKMGTHRTPHEAMRAVHWEWLAAHKQRELNKQIGVHVSDEDFHRELNTVMHDAVHRAITGRFSDPAQEKFVPHSHMVPLSTSLALIAGAAQKMGLHPHETARAKAAAPVAEAPVAKSESPEQLVPRIHRLLTDDLRKDPWKGNPNALAGHCYVASEALYHKLGGQRSGWVPHFVVHENSPHWFLKHRETGQIMDPTASQFSTPVPYNLGKGKGFLTREPSARAAKVLAGLSKAEGPNLVPVRGHASMADSKTEKLYSPEEVAEILLKATREKIAAYAVEIENLRKRESNGLAKAIIPVHAHNQGVQAGSGTEDVPAAAQAGKPMEKVIRGSEFKGAATDTNSIVNRLKASNPAAFAPKPPAAPAPAAKAEKCMKCGEMHREGMEKCGEMSVVKDEPSPEYKDSSDLPTGTPNEGEKDLPHDKLEEEVFSKSMRYCKSSSCSRELLGKAEYCARHERSGSTMPAMQKFDEVEFGAYLAKAEKCSRVGCNNPKTGTKYCSRACSIAHENPALHGKLKAAAGGDKGAQKEIHDELSKSDLMKTTPPGVSEATMHKLKRQYKGDKAKAYATAWKIHNEMKKMLVAKNATNQFFNNGADSIADAGDTGKSPANAQATSASNQVGHQAGGAGDNMPLGEGNVLNKGTGEGLRREPCTHCKTPTVTIGPRHDVVCNKCAKKGLKKGEQYVDNQGHVVETGIEPTATLPPQAKSKARSRGVVPQHKEKNGQVLRNGEDNGSGGVVLPGASLRRPGRTAGKKGGDVSGDRGMLNLGGITEPSQEGFGDSGPSGNDKTYDKRGEGKTDVGPGKPAGGKTYSLRGEGDVAPGAVDAGLKKAVYDDKEPNDKCQKCGKKAVRFTVYCQQHMPQSTSVRGQDVKKAAPGAVPTAKPSTPSKAPASSSTPTMTSPKPAGMSANIGSKGVSVGMKLSEPAAKASPTIAAKGPVGPAAGGVGTGMGGSGGGASGGKSEPKVTKAVPVQPKAKPSPETQAWAEQPAGTTPSPRSPMQSVLGKAGRVHGAPVKGVGKPYGPGMFPGTEQKSEPVAKAGRIHGAPVQSAGKPYGPGHFPSAGGTPSGSVKLPGSHLLPANPAAPKATAAPGPLKVDAPKVKPGIFGKLGRRQ